jgi:copper chaperone
MKFKTNIMCGACIAKVTDTLNMIVGEGNWNMDTSSADKVLEIQAQIDEETLNSHLNGLGYKASYIS